MTDRPDDQIDAYESRLARRVGLFSEQAVLPIDPVGIAASVAVGARRRSLRGRSFGSAGLAGRLALIGAGALLIVAFGAVIGGGGGLLGPSPSATASQAAMLPGRTSPSPSAPSHAAPSPVVCGPNDLDARVTAWEGAAGHRIATVEVRNRSGMTCWIPDMAQPELVDRNGNPLIVGEVPASVDLISMAPGDVLHTLVQDGNYCGPAPEPPVRVAFLQGEALIVAEALSPTDIEGVPGCSGPSAPSTIEMQPWQR